MDIAVLFICSLLATIVAWIYLNVQKPRSIDQEDKKNDAETPVDTSMNDTDFRKKLFLAPKKSRLLFLALMLVSLLGISVALLYIYKSNSLIDNCKIITLLAILFVAANIDARYRIIPNALVLFGVVMSVVFWLIELLKSPQAFLVIMKNDLTACLLVVAFFVIGVLLVKGGIGMGDIKLMLVMCLFQGFYGVVSSLFCSLFVAFIYAIGVLLLRKKSKKDSVAFAPAILIGTIISVLLTGM